MTTVPAIVGCARHCTVSMAHWHDALSAMTWHFWFYCSPVCMSRMKNCKNAGVLRIHFANSFSKKSAVIDYAADMSLLLYREKCIDDWNDERKFTRKVAADFLSRDYKQALKKVSSKKQRKFKRICSSFITMKKHKNPIRIFRQDASVQS